MTKGLRKSFRPRRGADTVDAVRGIDLNVAEGEIYGLLGPNGAGKTTTLRMLATLLAPDGGAATVAGADLRAEPGEVRRRIGYVAQGGGTTDQATAREELVLQARMYGVRKAEAQQRAKEGLAAFDLGEFGDRPCKTYSGGQRRRLDLALGVVHRPRVLFLDEPTVGLDPRSRAQVWSEVRRLREQGMTVLLTTHYLDEADALCDRIGIVDHGGIVTEGTPEQLKQEISGDAVTIGLPGAGTPPALRTRSPNSPACNAWRRCPGRTGCGCTWTPRPPRSRSCCARWPRPGWSRTTSSSNGPAWTTCSSPSPAARWSAPDAPSARRPLTAHLPDAPRGPREARPRHLAGLPAPTAPDGPLPRVAGRRSAPTPLLPAAVRPAADLRAGRLGCAQHRRRLPDLRARPAVRARRDGRTVHRLHAARRTARRHHRTVAGDARQPGRAAARPGSAGDHGAAGAVPADRRAGHPVRADRRPHRPAARHGPARADGPDGVLGLLRPGPAGPHRRRARPGRQHHRPAVGAALRHPAPDRPRPGVAALRRLLEPVLLGRGGHAGAVRRPPGRPRGLARPAAHRPDDGPRGRLGGPPVRPPHPLTAPGRSAFTAPVGRVRSG
ncbi:hypothetical protein KCH_66960 [Kitasatospora cheerisanensis KCTC 2395]|uniref:ABC transporter domain-containing protein n=1 Tax=Kitasatospora cheerisanensis KCTC 2395 TaxID=1348663 RepID=A0A066YIZ1_9ACTN|nr:hypothetical protein KCH_66960 [Kitasatospora cheerisanensis KCTC 2395]